MKPGSSHQRSMTRRWRTIVLMAKYLLNEAAVAKARKLIDARQSALDSDGVRCNRVPTRRTPTWIRTPGTSTASGISG